MHRREAHQHGTAYLWLIAAHVHTWTKTARAYQPVRLSFLFHTSKIQIRLPPSLTWAGSQSWHDCENNRRSLPLSMRVCCLASLLLPPVYPLFLPLPRSFRYVRKGNSNAYSINHASTPRMPDPPPPSPQPLACARASPANTSASRILKPRRQPDKRNSSSLDNSSITLIPKPQAAHRGTAATPSHCRQSASTACSSCVRDGCWSSGASAKKSDQEYIDGGCCVPHLRAPRSLPEP